MGNDPQRIEQLRTNMDGAETQTFVFPVARKLLDVSRLAQMGLHARIGLRDGLESTYRWLPENQCRLRA